MSADCDLIYRHLVRDVEPIRPSAEEVCEVYRKNMQSYDLKTVLDAEVLSPIYYSFIRDKEKIYGNKELWSKELVIKTDYEFSNKYYKEGKLI